MGKGDIRTRRGKVWRGTYGVTRPRRWKTTTPTIVAKPRKVKALKDLPKAVAAEPIKKIVVEAVQPQHIETKVHTPEVKTPVVAEVHQPVVAETAPVIEVHAVETAHAEVEVKVTAKKPAAKKAPAKKAPAAKKPAAAKKVPAKKKK
jgi:ribosomal small subunit protein bTHX